MAISVQAVPPVLNYAGQVAVNGEAFEGNGLFKFALVNADGTTTYWSNDGTSVVGSEPQASVAVVVSGGLYSILLGNTAQQGMGAIDPAVFAQHNDAKLRVWFSDGVNGFQQLSPDRPFASVPYAFSAGIAQTAVSAPIANGAVTKSMLGSDVIADLNKTVTYNRLAPSAIDAISSASLSSITDGKIKIVPFGQTPPSGYSLYHRGKAENLNWEFISDSGHWSGINRSVLTSDRLISFSNSIWEKYPIDSNWIVIKSTELSHGHAANSYMGKVYITGGVNDNVSTNKVRVYDISTERFSVGNSLPIPIRNHSAIVFSDNLFVIGGLREGTGQKSTFRYNFTNDEWDEKKSLNFNRSSSSTDIYGGRIWITGGYAYGNATNSVESYDLTDNKWHIESPMNVVREFHSSWVYNNHLFVAGGKDGNQSLDTIECYDPNTKTWYEWGKLPNSIHSSAAFVVKDILYIFSGYGLRGTLKLDLTNSTSNLSDIYIQDLNTTSPVQAEVADGSVTGSKMADGAVTASKIASNAITTNELSEQILKYLKPEITTQPQAQTVYADNNVSFSVTAEGKYLTYQWKKDGVDLAGETNATLNISDANATLHDGNYSVVVSNDFGSVESNKVEVQISDVLLNGLVGWWKFDEGSGTVAYDSSGNGNDGNLTNGPTWTAGKIGGALSFDGVNDYLKLSKYSLHTNFSVSFWANPTSNTNTFSESINANTANLGNHRIILYGSRPQGFPPSSNAGFGISIGKNSIYATAHSSNLYTPILVRQASFSDWTSFTFIVNNNTPTLFVDGELIKNGLNPNKTLHLISNSGFAIGKGAYGSYHGLIDDVRIYDRALSAEEVQALYNLGQ